MFRSLRFPRMTGRGLSHRSQCDIHYPNSDPSNCPGDMLTLPAPETRPPPAAVQRMLIWHQGALGDLLLAGPALAALSRHYTGARITALGHPERWGLLAPSLPLDKSGTAARPGGSICSVTGTCPPRFGTPGPVSAGPDLRPSAPNHPARPTAPGGHPGGPLAPLFPETDGEAVAALQARRLAAWDLPMSPALSIWKWDWIRRRNCRNFPAPAPGWRWPRGAGPRRKNWPLAHYYEVSRALGWEYGLRGGVAGRPREGKMLPFLGPLTKAQGQLLLANRPLARVARVLSRCRLYIGNDSGLTHLAAAVAGPEVLALFGPTDPRVWAPLGRRFEPCGHRVPRPWRRWKARFPVP